ncbi:MAG TPA: hypothetical protein V6C82_07000 [Chroococcales cyanobacterium]
MSMRIDPNVTPPLRKTANLNKDATHALLETPENLEKTLKKTPRPAVPPRETLIAPGFLDSLPLVLRLRVQMTAAKMDLPAQEGNALRELKPEQQRKYLDLAAQLYGPGREALKGLLLDGKLSDPGLLDNLSKLATQPLAAGMKRGELLSSTLGEIADPASINQGNRQTCAAATAQILLAKENPAEYARIVAGLASPKGKVVLANGQTLERDKNWKQDNSGRSITGSLTQSAFMQYASGGYDSASDSRADGAGQGLYADEQDKLLKALTGENNQSVSGNSDEIMAQLAKATKDGHSIAATLQVTDPNTGRVIGHSVSVEKIEEGKVSYLDPHEGRKTVSLSEFQAKIDSVSLPQQYLTPSLKKKEEKVKAEKGRGKLAAGWFSSICKAVGGAISSVGKAVGSAVKAVGNAVGGAVKAVGSVIPGPLGKGLQSLGSGIQSAGKAIGNGIQAVGNAIGDGVKEVGKLAEKAWEKIKDGLTTAWDTIKKWSKKAWDWVKENSGYIIMAAQIVCMFVPGLQVVSLALTAYQAAQGLKDVYDGIKSGDWKKALMGVVSVAGSFAGGVSAVANGALGAAATGVAKGLETAAKIAKTAANVARGVAAGIDAAQGGDILGAIGGVAGAFAGGADVVGDKIAAIADKVSDYAKGAKAAYSAWKNGDIADGIAAGLSLASNVSQDAGADAEVTNKLDQFAGYAKKADAIEDAIDDKDYGGLLSAAGDTIGGDKGKVLSQAGHAVRAIQNEDYAEIASILGDNLPGKAGETLSKAGAIIGAVQDGDYASAASILGKEIPGDVGKLLVQGGDIAKAVQNKDYGKLGGILNDTLGGDFGETLSKAGDIADAVEKRDYGKIASTLGIDLGEPVNQLLAQSKDIAALVEKKDYARLAKIAGNALGGESGDALKKAGNIAEAIEEKDYAGAAAILGKAMGGKVGKALCKSNEIADAAQKGDLARIAEELDIDLPPGIEEKIARAKGIAESVQKKDYFEVAEQLGIEEETLAPLKKFVSAEKAAEEGDLLGAAQTISGKTPEELKTIVRQQTAGLADKLLKAQNALKDAIRLGNQEKLLEMIAPGLDMGKVLEKETAKRLSQAQAELKRLEEAGRSGDFGKILSASSNISLLTGLLSSKEVRDLGQSAEQFQKIFDSVKSGNSEEALKLAQNLSLDRIPDLNSLKTDLSERIGKNLNSLEGSLMEGKPALAENLAHKLASDLQFESVLRGA